MIRFVRDTPARGLARGIVAAGTVLLGGGLSALSSPGAVAAQDATPRPLTLEDYGDWNRITQVRLSPDGRWLAYTHQPNDGDETLFVKSLEGGGAVYDATKGAGPEFSKDGRWVAFLVSPPEPVSPPEEDAERLEEASESVPSALHLIDLTSGERIEEPSVRAFRFSEGGGHIAIHRRASDDDAEHEGSDLLLRNLTAGTVLSLGNVSQYAFDEAGRHFAYLVDADQMAGNGLYLITLEQGAIQPLHTSSARYEDMEWTEAGDAVLALAGSEVEGKKHRENRLVVASGIGATVATEVHDLAGRSGFPEGFVLSELADTRWSEDGTRVLLGIKAQEDELDEDDEERANVDIWHWADERLQSTQMVQADADGRYTYTSVLNLSDGTFHRLADDAMRRVEVTDDGRWGIGRRDFAYRGDVTEAGGRADLVRIDLETGAADDIATAIRRPLGASPDGAYFVYLEDEQVYAVELATLERSNLSEGSGVDFVNREFDRINEAPAYGVGGWTEMGEILLYDRWDVWSVSLEDGAATNLTGGTGAAQEIRFRLVRLDPDADFVDPDEAIVSAYEEWTKRSGYFAVVPGRAPRPLLFGDEMIGGLRKAEDADRVIFTRQTFEQFPDYWTADSSFRNPEQITDANPQIIEFAWGRRVLIDYADERGNELQATLALPAGYVEGERYPMVVYFYEKMSQRHHHFSLPVYDDRPHMSTYASNGYLVLMPDIVYDDGYPGSSALDDVTAAARRTIELGYVDPDRIGLQGHSWGGYETSFILTQTDMFAAIVTGAPLTNLMSMNNILYKRTGNQNGPILEWSQGRMGDQPWDDFERWVSQSPVHHAPNISTPFLIMHGTEDGAVDWNQGLELYTAARRLEKEVILLSYPDEPHHLAKEANQKDFQIRMRQYFDHHLKGLPAPEWMTDGVPFLRKDGEGPDGKKVIL
jgi:dipeptidyl aminopeptidase/acylaminoacyl peptidase